MPEREPEPAPTWYQRIGVRVARVVPVKIIGVVAVILLLYVGASRIADNVVRGPNDQNVPLPATRFGPVAASSYRQNVSSPGAQPVSALLDDNPATTWLECAGGEPVNSTNRMARGTCDNLENKGTRLGIGEYIILPLLQPTDIKAISIRNGRQPNQREFYRNGRVQDVTVEIWKRGTPNSEGPSMTLTPKTLADEMGYQSFPLDCDLDGVFTKVSHCDNVTQIRLTIVSVYKGEKQPVPKPAKDGPEIDPALFMASTDTGLSDVQVIPTKVAIPFSELAKPLTG